MNTDAPPQWAAYRAAVTRFTDAIDRVLEQGRVAQARYAQLSQWRAPRTSGDPADPLHRKALPPDQRHVQQGLVQLTDNLCRTLLRPIPPSTPSGRNTAPRALGSRHRI